MDTKETTMRDSRIDWHSAFYDAIRMELVQDRDKLLFECVLSETEHQILHSASPERLYGILPKKKKRISALVAQL
jgi:hypothetical protein